MGLVNSTYTVTLYPGFTVNHRIFENTVEPEFLMNAREVLQIWKYDMKQHKNTSRRYMGIGKSCIVGWYSRVYSQRIYKECPTVQGDLEPPLPHANGLVPWEFGGVTIVKNVCTSTGILLDCEAYQWEWTIIQKCLYSQFWIDFKVLQHFVFALFIPSFIALYWFYFDSWFKVLAVPLHHILPIGKIETITVDIFKNMGFGVFTSIMDTLSLNINLYAKSLDCLNT